MTEISDRVLILTVQIVSAWLAANPIGAAAVSDLIKRVQKSLNDLASDHMATGPRSPRPADQHPPLRPAVDVQRSVYPDRLVCLEDGDEMTLLKRHLRTEHGMTPEEYRAKWGLPASYPMVAPNYRKIRSRLAREAGFGRGGRPGI